MISFLLLLISLFQRVKTQHTFFDDFSKHRHGYRRRSVDGFVQLYEVDPQRSEIVQGTEQMGGSGEAIEAPDQYYMESALGRIGHEGVELRPGYFRAAMQANR